MEQVPGCEQRGSQCAAPQCHREPAVFVQRAGGAARAGGAECVPARGRACDSRQTVAGAASFGWLI